MKFSIFSSVKSARGRECTYDEYLCVTHSSELLKLCQAIAKEENKNARAELKKGLPVITWQAYFSGSRKNAEAEPSGLFMLDIDHVEDPYKLYKWKVAGRLEELGIVYVGKTASLKGLRIVAKCRKEFSSLPECQLWLAGELGVVYDAACKDWARCSFVVHDSYTLYMDAGAIWEREAVEGTRYEVEKADSVSVRRKRSERSVAQLSSTDEGEIFSGGAPEYRGVGLGEIAETWLRKTGGMPEEGERNARLYKLALRMRYITDFNEAAMLQVMPRCGLGETEMSEIVRHAIKSVRAADMPLDMKMVIDQLVTAKELGGEGVSDNVDEADDDFERMPTPPPVFRQYAGIAPDDFKSAVVLCQLPILGALGSRLRAEYLDGKMHSPSFMVSLEAPQASGKSFMRMLVDEELRLMIEHDEEQRKKEREYDAKVKEMKLLNVKVTKKDKEDVLGQRPESLIRYVPPTISITKLFMRMNDAKGLHLFTFAEEIDTVTKAFKRSFSSLSDLLRVGFDNGSTGQDYASENSFSGVIPIYYNTLYSGTPKAMCRFYPDIEDGLVSRVCFVTLPDQFGKGMPTWGKMSAADRKTVDICLAKLNEVSIMGDEVQDVHVMKMGWLNSKLGEWLSGQQRRAVLEKDRTRDIFCRRAAVVGFRAGMLAWFLYDERNTPTIRRSVMSFALWVASSMLNQHLLRFKIEKAGSNTNKYEDLFEELPQEFTREQVERMRMLKGYDTPTRMIIYKWRLGGLIEPTEMGLSKNNQNIAIKFKKK